jgi:predicted RecA/RadA family phage recombinase
MQKFVKAGATLRWTNGTGATVTSDSLVLVGRYAGVAIADIANGDTGALVIRGVANLPKAAGLAIAQGAAVGWNGTAVTTAEGATPIGVCHTAVGSAAATVDVDLNVNLFDIVSPATLAALDAGEGVPFIIEADVSAAAASVTIFDDDCPRDLKILDMVVHCTATVSSGSVKLTDGAADITNAVVMATDEAVTRLGTIDTDKSELAAGDSLVAVKNATTNQGILYITCVAV